MPRAPFATGLRNPTALAFEPGTAQLWVVVNERDELGPDLVPDYLTSVREGAFYGWPYAYWGPNPDTRVQPQDAQKVQAAVRPDFAFPSHSAPLGLAIVRRGGEGPFAEGAFVGLRGSWNRPEPAGYKVVFVPFRDGRPAGAAVDVVTGFQAEGKTMGRPGRGDGWMPRGRSSLPTICPIRCGGRRRGSEGLTCSPAEAPAAKRTPRRSLGPTSPVRKKPRLPRA